MIVKRDKTCGHRNSEYMRFNQRQWRGLVYTDQRGSVETQRHRHARALSGPTVYVCCVPLILIFSRGFRWLSKQGADNIKADRKRTAFLSVGKGKHKTSQ